MPRVWRAAVHEVLLHALNRSFAPRARFCGGGASLAAARLEGAVAGAAAGRGAAGRLAADAEGVAAEEGDVSAPSSESDGRHLARSCVYNFWGGGRQASGPRGAARGARRQGATTHPIVENAVCELLAPPQRRGWRANVAAPLVLLRGLRPACATAVRKGREDREAGAPPHRDCPPHSGYTACRCCIYTCHTRGCRRRRRTRGSRARCPAPHLGTLRVRLSRRPDRASSRSNAPIRKVPAW